MSGSYKTLNRTYRELREERLPQPQLVEEVEPEPMSEMEVEPEITQELEVESEPETEIELGPEVEVEAEVGPEVETEPVPEAIEPPEEVTPEPEPEVEPAPQPKPRARRKPATRKKPEAKAETATGSKSTKSTTKRKTPARKKPVEDTEVETVQEPGFSAEPASPALEITVAELLTAFEEDGEAADTRFSDQILRISGVANRIEVKDNLNIYYIILNSTGGSLLLQGVRCVFDGKYGDELSKLITGQAVRVEGKYAGSMIDISIRDCVLIS